MEHTEHSQIRVQQRGIPPLILQWLDDYGTSTPSNGAMRVCFDHAARKRLSDAIGHQVVDRLGDLLNIYMVAGEHKIVTAGHRTRRFRHK